jgi:uncharacterized protein
MRRALLPAAWLIAATALALAVPPTPHAWFTDYAGVVGSQQAGAIDARLQDLERRTGHQVIAVIFPSLEGEPLEDFTIRCAEAWRVGRKSLDDGMIFFAFLKDRRMRLEVGYGLEDKVPDAIAERLLDETVKPYFARQDYGGGILALTAALDKVFHGEPVPPHKEERRHAPAGQAGLIVLILVMMFVQGILRRRGVGAGRGRRRGIFWGGPWWGGFGGGGFGGFGGGGGGGGFSGGGGSFGGGGASGSW